MPLILGWSRRIAAKLHLSVMNQLAGQLIGILHEIQDGFRTVLAFIQIHGADVTICQVNLNAIQDWHLFFERFGRRAGHLDAMGIMEQMLNNGAETWRGRLNADHDESRYIR